MFEITLVPKVKYQMLRAQKIRNVVIFFCIVVSSVMVGIVVVLGTTYASQLAVSQGRSREIDVAYAKIMEQPDVEETLTLQNQLTEIGELVDGKYEFSRVLGVINDIIPRNPQTGSPTVTFSEISFSANKNSIYFDAQSREGFVALEALLKTIDRLYYDYGNYYNRDGKVVQVAREEVAEDGAIYGVYVDKCAKGAANCQDKEIKIKRYTTDKDKNESGYYYATACNYDGKNYLTSTCRLIPQTSVNYSNVSYGRTSEGFLVLRFSIAFSIDNGALDFQNRNVRIVGITKQNVTDSFLQLNNTMFAERANDVNEKDLTEEEKEQLDGERGL
ncbi:MAG: hypothetical protein LBQ02_03745 [Candidatus Nomurabacteria bacterium]|jgi:hypothetical protein|nr:hypothetical protein [Candidatus Nomurabacteria bacterium]